ncbi:hypothetical protein F53441_13563 [Fusarium austroafricanum]|uniref:Uncharacterized protein n=1 Tax=Fusarium austroafricanum TaxID=2364996 RepID=A0A8H4JQF1_9HYPO|nr:hypothetical protein F53441_13563 [Fusarium austroafricanum]
MKLTATLLALNLPSLGMASVYNNWAFSSAPNTGLQDITFPISMKGAPHKSGFYFAQQFNFIGIPDVGYTGLQPRLDARGKSVVHAAFSSFQNGTTTRHRNCHTGADGGPGVSCAIDINGNYNHLYNITVWNVKGTTWRGTLIDTVTGKSNVIGEWTLPSAAGNISNGQLGFVEYYNWNDGSSSHVCSSQPKTHVFFGNPTSKTQGASGGAITSIWEDGECVGKLGYKGAQSVAGWKIQVGFK